MYYGKYKSPLGEIILESDDIGLIGLYFLDNKKDAKYLAMKYQEKENIKLAKRWLDEYFSGKKPTIEIDLHPTGTNFQKEVWNIVKKIPYAKTTTYGDIAKRIAKKRGAKIISAQAVGKALSKNPILLLIGCHRVIGYNGSLTGYAGGIDRKIELLKLEIGNNYIIDNNKLYCIT